MDEKKKETPFRGEVPCYWCKLENKNAGLPPEKCGMIKASCKAKGSFEGKYACANHGNLLMISGWYGGQLEKRPTPAMKLLSTAIDEIIVERGKQKEKWGDQSHKTDEVWLAILVEEVGEAAKAILENGDNLKEEILQTAAVATAWLEKKIGEGE